jgi:hypothetical protein
MRLADKSSDVLVSAVALLRALRAEGATREQQLFWLGLACQDLAQFAKHMGEGTLSYLLDMAALEASLRYDEEKGVTPDIRTATLQRGGLEGA